MKMLPIIQRKVKSRSNPDTYHIVSLYDDGHLECDCIAGQMKKVCHHQKIFNQVFKNGKNIK